MTLYSLANLYASSFELCFQQIDGCINITADSNTVGWDYRYNQWDETKVVFNGNVTENATGEIAISK